MSALPFVSMTGPTSRTPTRIVAALEPGVIKAADAGWCGTTTPTGFWTRLPRHRPSEPVAAGPAVRQAGAVRGRPRLYQVRGLDLSNMTLVEGDQGVIVIDPLISTETRGGGLACTASIAATGR